MQSSLLHSTSSRCDSRSLWHSSGCRVKPPLTPSDPVTIRPVQASKYQPQRQGEGNDDAGWHRSAIGQCGSSISGKATGRHWGRDVSVRRHGQSDKVGHSELSRRAVLGCGILSRPDGVLASTWAINGTAPSLRVENVQGPFKDRGTV